MLETVNLFREEPENAVEKLEERAREPRERLDQLKVDMPSAPSFDIEELVNKYESDLRERITETAGKIPALPGVSELEVIKRALGRRKSDRQSWQRQLFDR